MKTHSEIIDEAYETISEMHEKLFAGSQMHKSWDFDIVKGESVGEGLVEIIRSHDELVELHVLPTTKIGRSAWTYEVWPIFQEDGPGKAIPATNLNVACIEFIATQFRMKIP